MSDLEFSSDDEKDGYEMKPAAQHRPATTAALQKDSFLDGPEPRGASGLATRQSRARHDIAPASRQSPSNVPGSENAATEDKVGPGHSDCCCAGYMHQDLFAMSTHYAGRPGQWKAASSCFEPRT